MRITEGAKNADEESDPIIAIKAVAGQFGTGCMEIQHKPMIKLTRFGKL